MKTLQHIAVLVMVAFFSLSEYRLVSAQESDAKSTALTQSHPRQITSFPPGTDCSGSEGAWNCLSNEWQRCVSGLWDGLTQAATGTMCRPIGLSFDFHVVSSSSSSSSSTSTSMPVWTSSIPCECTSPVTPTSVTSLPPYVTTPSSTVSSWTAYPSSTCYSSVGYSCAVHSGGTFISRGSGIGSQMAIVIVGVGAMAIVFARLLI